MSNVDLVSAAFPASWKKVADSVWFASSWFCWHVLQCCGDAAQHVDSAIDCPNGCWNVTISAGYHVCSQDLQSGGNPRTTTPTLLSSLFSLLSSLFSLLSSLFSLLSSLISHLSSLISHLYHFISLYSVILFSVLGSCS